MKSKNTSCALGTIAALYCLPLNTPVVAFAPSPDNVPINNQKKSRSSLAKISLQAATKQRTENESEINSTETITTARTGARRTFIGEAIKATVTASGLTVGMFLNVDMDGHPVNCECNDCNGNKMEVLSHAPGCQCDSCVHFFRGPLSASAYETEDDDGSKRSADYYAQVIQVGLKCMLSRDLTISPSSPYIQLISHNFSVELFLREYR